MEINKNYEEPDYKDVIIETKKDCFQIGQCYEDKPALKLECKKCGNDKFFVGSGNYYTAIKCPVCKWEVCIHEG